MIDVKLGQRVVTSAGPAIVVGFTEGTEWLTDDRWRLGVIVRVEGDDTNPIYEVSPNRIEAADEERPENVLDWRND